MDGIHMMHIKSTAMQVQKGGVVYSGDINWRLVMKDVVQCTVEIRKGEDYYLESKQYNLENNKKTKR
jgi:hypothetical protein